MSTKNGHAPALARSIRRYQRTQKANLPTPFEQEWAVFYLNPSLDEYQDLEGQDNIVYLATFIRAWSLLDDDDEPLPVTEENLRRIGHDLVRALDTAYGLLTKSPLVETTADSSPPTAPATETPASPTGTPSA